LKFYFIAAANAVFSIRLRTDGSAGTLRIKSKLQLVRGRSELRVVPVRERRGRLLRGCPWWAAVRSVRRGSSARLVDDVLLRRRGVRGALKLRIVHVGSDVRVVRTVAHLPPDCERQRRSNAALVPSR